MTKPDDNEQNVQPPKLGDVVYNNLRNEILKRIEIRYNLINYALVIFGTLTVLSFNIELPVILFIYVLIASALAFAWLDNHNYIKLISLYLQKYDCAWEIYVNNFRATKEKWYRFWLGVLSGSGIFLGTQVTAFCIAVYKLNQKGELTPQNTKNWIVLVISFTVMMLTFIMFSINGAMLMGKSNNNPPIIKPNLLKPSKPNHRKP